MIAFTFFVYLIIIVAGYNERQLTECEKYDINKDTWENIQRMPSARSKFTSVQVSKDKVLVIGGKDSNGNRLDSILEYNIEKNLWTTCSFKLPTIRSSFASVLSPEGILYICGGSDGRILNTFISLDTKTNKWKSLENLHEKREENALVLGPDNKIYAVGGFNGKKSLSSVERYDPRTGHWEIIPSLKTSRRSLCAVAMPDGIYALGGHDGERAVNSVERFDIQAFKWINVESMTHCKYAMAAVNSLDFRYIYVLGGYSGKAINTLERYDIVKGVWENMKGMQHPRIMHAAICG